MKAGFIATVLSAIAVLTSPAYAHCPLCTAATGFGVAAARLYGIDDVISGLWIGAFVMSTALWFDRVLKKKYTLKHSEFIISTISLLLTVIPFYFAGLFTNPVKIIGIDRFLFGIVAGSIITFSGTQLSIWIKNKRGGVLFPFQTIILVLIALTFVSVSFSYIIRNTGVLG